MEDSVDQQRQEIEARLDKLGRDAEKIAANARNALDRLRREDVQAACDIVALSHYPISHVRARSRRSYGGVHRRVESSPALAGRDGCEGMRCTRERYPAARADG